MNLALEVERKIPLESNTWNSRRVHKKKKNLTQTLKNYINKGFQSGILEVQKYYAKRADENRWFHINLRKK